LLRPVGEPIRVAVAFPAWTAVARHGERSAFPVRVDEPEIAPAFDVVLIAQAVVMLAIADLLELTLERDRSNTE